MDRFIFLPPDFLLGLVLVLPLAAAIVASVDEKSLGDAHACESITNTTFPPDMSI